MIGRRRLLQVSAGVLAAPAVVEKAGAQSAFDWKQCKGQRIEVSLTKSPRGDVLQAHQKEFEELTGIRVGSEQVPEQQHRPKVAIELASGHPGFDVITISLHVQKKLIEKGKWLDDLRPYIRNASLTGPDFDEPDFSAAGMRAATGADGRLNVLPLNQDLWIIYYNKEMFARKGIAYPKTMDEMMAAAAALTDKSKGEYGFVGRGLKNANVVLWSSMLLGQDQETVTPDGRKLLTDTPAAIWAGEYYKKILSQYAPPGVVAFNWNECQTTFAQGRAAMWWDGIGFSAPLMDPSKSKITKSVGFGVVPAGPKARNSATFIDGIGIPGASKRKQAAWLYVQWATGKKILTEMLRTGSGTPPRATPYRDTSIVKDSPFPQEWFDTTLASLKIAREGLPEIVPVTEFRDTIGVALTNTLTGADVATELKQATAAFQKVLDKSNAA